MIKNFCLKSLKIIIFPTIFIFLLFFIFKIKVNNIKINEKTNTLILGDSHTQSGLDDSKIKNSLNISQSSEHFLYSYNVLKLLLNNNSQINKVILGVSFHSFSKFNDEYIRQEEKTIHMFPKYLPIIDLKSTKDINGLSIKHFKGIFKSIISGVINGTDISKYKFIGSFYKSNTTNVNDNTINSAIKRHYYINKDDIQDFSNYQEKYLNKIIQLCHSRNIELIIINTPIHFKYYNKIPSEFISNYYSIVNKYKNKLCFYDYHSFNFPQSHYGDGDHLNSFGSKKFSFLINERINKKNLLN